MLALVLLIASGVTGVWVAALLSPAAGAFTRFAIGAAIAQLLLLFVPLYFAYSFDLGVARAGLLSTLVLAAAGASGCAVSKRRLRELARELVRALREPRNRPSVWVGAALLSVLGWLHFTHYLRPFPDGLHSGGVTWGDLSLHAAFASRFLKAEALPAFEHPLFLGGPLIYPFVPDYSVAVLSSLGLGLRWAFICGGSYAFAALLLAVHAATRAWLPGTRALEPILVLALFLLAGGFGFVFFGARVVHGESLLELLRNVNATYDISPHIAKGGHIGNLFLASRCAGYGMAIGLCGLVLLGQAPSQPGRIAPRIAAGITIGALPLVHTHSFLVCSGVMLWQLALARPRPGFAGAAACLGPWFVVAVPQLLFLSHGAEWNFVRFEPGFLRPAQSGLDWFLDLVLGMGPGFLLLPWALRGASRHTRRTIAPLLALLPLVNFVAFAPAAYDNIKLVAWFDLGLAIALAGWLGPKLCASGAARLGASLALLGCTASGVLAVGYELANDGLVLSNADVRFARLVEAHSRPDAVIATAASYHDPVVMLAGRRTLMSTPHMARLNGMNVTLRAREIFQLYAGGAPARALIERFDVYAVVVGPAERSDLPAVDEAFFARNARAVYETDGRRLYVLDRQPSR